MRAQDLTDAAREAAEAAWRAPGLRPRRDSVALLRAPWLDGLTRSHPAQPYVVALPIAAFAARHVASLDLATATSSFALGLVAWTLAEYAMHRFLFHANVRTEAGRVWTFLAHGHHHVWPQDPRRLAATPIQLGSTILFFHGVFAPLPSEATRGVALAGALVGYVAYEAAHYLAHHGRPRSRLLRALAHHHLAHHHVAPQTRWGIGTPLWDLVCGTMGRASVKRGPAPIVGCDPS